MTTNKKKAKELLYKQWHSLIKLSNAIAKAGGPYGYAIVINIDDKQEPVSIEDIIPFLKLAMQK